MYKKTVSTQSLYRKLPMSGQTEQADVAERYRAVVENGRQGIVVHWDEEILYANPALAKMFGYASGEELVGRNLFETLAAPEDRPRLQTYREARMRGEDVPPTLSWS